LKPGGEAAEKRPSPLPFLLEIKRIVRIRSR
jgi:hypothetical protein